MIKIAAIIYSVLCLQVFLGVAMIATASIASNRQVNAGSRLVDALLRVIGRGSVALGGWGIVCTLAAPYYVSASAKFDLLRFLGYVAAFVYSLLILVGGWFQGRVASSLLNPPPIEEQRRREYRVTLLRGIGWTLALMPLGPMAGIYFLAVGLFGGTLRVQQESLLLILAVAMRTRAPLAEECEALADASRGRFRNRLRELAARLRRGDRLSDALRSIPALAPAQTVTALRLAEDLGNVAEVASQEALRFRRREEDRLQGRFSTAGLTFYVCCFAVLATGILGFLMWWVVPKFLKIFQDFDAPVPGSTQALLDVTAFLGSYWYLTVMPVVAFVAWALYMLLKRGGWSGINWGFASTLYPRLETPTVLRSLAQAVVCHHPLLFGIEGLEVHHPQHGIRARMKKLREQIAGGKKTFEPLAACGLLTARESEALACAERAGNLAWVLDSLADTIERRHRLVAESFMETLHPLVIAAVGLLVCGISIGLFYPIIQIIQVGL